MANPNQLTANTAEADWHPASQTAELQKAAELDRSLPETRVRRFGRLALRFLKLDNNRAEAPLVEGSAAELAERNRLNKESSDLAAAKWDEQTEAIKRGEQPEATPASPDKWDYGDVAATTKSETNPGDAKDWDYGEGTKRPESEPASVEKGGWDYGDVAATTKSETNPSDAEDWNYSEGTDKPEENYRGLDPNLYVNGGTTAEKQAWSETHPAWKSEQPVGVE